MSQSIRRAAAVTAAGLVGAAVALTVVRPGPAVAQGGVPGAAIAPSKVATVDILSIVERLVISDEFKGPRDKFYADTDAPVEAILADLRAMEAKAKDLKPDAPELPAMREQYQKRSEEYQQAGRPAASAKERFSATQVSQAYSRAVTAARAMATSLGYSHVVASRVGELTLRSDNVPGAVQEILARPAVMSPPSDDLTDQLLKQLNLDKVTPPVPTQVVPSPAAPVADPGKK